MWGFARPFVLVSKKNKVQNDNSPKWKQVQEKITAVNKKKAMLENTTRELTNDAGKYTMDAENVSKIEDIKTLLSKSNSFRTLQMRKMKN